MSPRTRFRVYVLIGSKSDEKYLKESKLIQYLRQEGIEVIGKAISAHRNLFELIAFVRNNAVEGTVFICGAGWAAALPGTVKAILLGTEGVGAVPVLGVALPSEEYPHASDAKVSIERLPPGVPVEYMGIGPEGFDAAGKRAAELINQHNHAVFADISAELAEKLSKKPPEDLDFDDLAYAA